MGWDGMERAHGSGVALTVHVYDAVLQAHYKLGNASGVVEVCIPGGQGVV